MKCTSKAEKGDLIRIIDNHEQGRYPIGAIMEVKERMCVDKVHAIHGDDGWLVGDEYYVIHRKAGEEDSEVDRLHAEIQRLMPSDDITCGDCGKKIKRSDNFGFCVSDCCGKLSDHISNVGDTEGADALLTEKARQFAETLGLTEIVKIDGVKIAEINKKLSEHTTNSSLQPDAQLDGMTQANRIRSACSELAELLVRKNHDYGDSFSQQYAKYGLMSALIRMDDKMRRLETLQQAENKAQVDESIDDTLLDLAGYALLTYVEVSKVGKRP